MAAISLAALVQVLKDIDDDLLMANPINEGQPEHFWFSAREKLKDLIEELEGVL